MADEKKQRLVIVDILRALACIMIFLYHCNTILPGEWKFLTVLGPEMGNNLFFMISGFAIMPSVRNTPKGGGVRWYLRRLLRILPVTLVSYLIMYIAGYYSFSDRAQLFAVFIYPTLYWFISAILLGYLVIYISGRYLPISVRMIAAFVLFLLYAFVAGVQERYYIIGLVSMMAGYAVRELLEAGKAFIPWKVLCLIAVLGIISFGAGRSFDIPLLIGGGVLASGLSALAIGFTFNGALGGITGHPILYKILGYLGDMALPLYIVQCFMGGYLGFHIGQTVDFPLSFVVNLVFAWGIGTLVLIFVKLTRLVKI